jgi:hypothetical protein
VAPAGVCSIAMTRDCFEPGAGFLVLRSLACSEGFAAGAEVADDTESRFFVGCDIGVTGSSPGAPTNKINDLAKLRDGRIIGNALRSRRTGFGNSILLYAAKDFGQHVALVDI